MQHISPFATRALTSLVALGLFHACAAPSGELEPGPRMKIRPGCLQTACQQRRASESRQCSDCTSTCFSAGYSCDPSTACEISCSPSRACSDWEHEECVNEGWQVTLPNNPSPAVEDACLRTRSAIRGCGLESAWTPDDCERIAKFVRPQMAPIFECYASMTSCDQWAAGDIAHCGVPVPSDFGDRFCAGIAGLCGEGCAAEAREALNAESGWWRADVAEAGLSCLDQGSCDAALDCYDAWFDALVEG